MLSKSLETDIRAVEEHLFGTGTYTMFQRIKTELEELAQQTNNTGSPKLPPYGDFEAWCRNASIHISVCKPIYDWFGRKLRASA